MDKALVDRLVKPSVFKGLDKKQQLKLLMKLAPDLEDRVPQLDTDLKSLHQMDAKGRMMVYSMGHNILTQAALHEQIQQNHLDATELAERNHQQTSAKLDRVLGVLSDLTSAASNTFKLLKLVNFNVLEISHKLDNIESNMDTIKSRIDAVHLDLKALRSDFSASLPDQPVTRDDLKYDLVEFTQGILNYNLFEQAEAFTGDARDEFERMKHATYGILSRDEVAETFMYDDFKAQMAAYQDASLDDVLRRAKLKMLTALKEAMATAKTSTLTAHEVSQVLEAVDIRYPDAHMAKKLKTFAIQELNTAQTEELEAAVEKGLTEEIDAVQTQIKQDQDRMAASSNPVVRGMAVVDRGITGDLSFNDGLKTLVKAESLVGLAMRYGTNKRDDFLKKHFGAELLTEFQQFERKEKALEEMLRYVTEAPEAITEFQTHLAKSGMALHDTVTFKVMGQAFEKAEQVLEATTFGLDDPDNQAKKDAMTVMHKLSALEYPQATQYLTGETSYMPRHQQQLFQYLNEHPNVLYTMRATRGEKQIGLPLREANTGYGLH